MSRLAVPPLNPVLARELKQRMRARHTWLVLTLYLAVLASILRWMYVAASRDDGFGGAANLVASAGVGRAMFQWLLFFMLLLVCFIVPGLTSGAISGERERKTLISLQITLLRARSIVLGKLLASLAFVVLLIIASLPLATVPFMLGGVSVSEVVRGIVMVVATAVTLACLALACSALVRRTQTATVLSYGMTLALVLGTLMVYGAQQIPRRDGGSRPDPWILTLNPLAATADVVQGRRESLGFPSPFQPLRDLLVLDEDERISQVMAGQARGEGFVGPDGRMPVGPDGAVIPRPLVTAVPLAPPANGGGDSSVDLPGGIVAGQLGIFDAQADPQPRLAGIRFWVVSLSVWLVVALVAVSLAVRRISLPAARESS